MGDGATQVAEVHAGSGYYSQSTAACFFGYPDSNPPVRVRVRWPSGASTAHEGPGRSRNLVLSAPAS
jgi:predicted Zn-dependent protease